MRSLILLVLGALLPALSSAQTTNTFFSTFDAERGCVLRPASDGNIWLGAMKNERVLLSKLNLNGKTLELHELNFTGTGPNTDYLTDVFEDSDGMLVGCGNFENDNQGRGFLFRYNPVTRNMLWSTVLRSDLTNLAGVLELGPGGDYLLYGNPQFSGGSDAEIIQFHRSNGQPVAFKNRRYTLNTEESFNEMIFYDGALYACGRFTGLAPAPEARMRSALCKIDTATFEPVWTRLGSLPVMSSGWFYGRDLLIEGGAVFSTFSGDHFTFEKIRSEVYLQKNDLDGNRLWTWLYQLPAFKSPFAEEIVSLPDGFLLFGHDLLSDTSRYFLLKTDKDGNAIRAVTIQHGYNDKFPENPSRSKMLRLGNAVYLTGMTQNALGQTQGILAKTDLDGWINDTCGVLRPTEVKGFVYDMAASEAVTPAQGPALASLESGFVQVDTPQLSFSKQCGVLETCPALPDLRLTLDSLTCTDGIPLLHYTVCNVGGQEYDGPSFFGLYAQNPITDSGDPITVVMHGVDHLASGDCRHWTIGSNPDPPMAFQLDTFTRLYGMLGVNLNTPTPIDPAAFPFTPNGPECGYLNNLDSIAVPDHMCGSCEDPNTFVKKLGSPQRTELGFSMCHAADGTIYVLGRQDNKVMISKIKADGEPIWTRNFPGSSNAPIGMAEIIEDSEGNLVFCGTQGTSINSRAILLMRYDPVAGVVLWYKHLGSANSDPEALGVMEKTPGGNYLVSSQRERMISGVLRSWAEIQEIDRTTGDDGVVGGLRLSFPGNPRVRFESMLIHQGSIYAVGNWQSTVLKPLFAKIDLTSTAVNWALQTTPDSTTTFTDASHRDMIIDNDLFVMVGDMQKSATDPAQGRWVYLAKHATNGTLMWMRRYDIDMRPEDVLALPNAYIVFGKMSDNRYGMFKTDKNGNLLSAKTLFTAAPPANSTSFNSRQNQLLHSGNYLLMLDHDQASNGLSDILLLRTDLNFNLDDPCSLLSSAVVGESALPAKIGATPLTKGIFSSGISDAGVMLTPDPLAVRKLCPECPCTDKPDITYQVDSVYCSPTEGPLAQVRICNLGASAVPGGFYLNFYDQNPMTGAATLLFSTFDLDKPAPGDCIEYALPLDAALLQFPKIYTLVGVQADVPTPVSIAGFPYPGGFAECDFTNNLDSFDVQVAAQKPDFGPDRSLCMGQSLTLDAGNGYFAYNWQNGPATQTFTVSATGAYSVAVTDACGRILRDTVRITVLPDVVPTTVTLGFYPGGTVFVAGTGYTQPDTIVQTLVSAAGCDSVVTTILTLLSSQISLQCPAPITVSLPAGQSTVNMNYDLPVATTTCPDPAIDFQRFQGPSSGSAFLPGETTVCYEAANQCGLRDTCCFSIKVEQPAFESACDIKTPPGCLRYELLDIRLDSIGQRRYRVRITNTCASPLEYAVVQLPDGVSAVSPKEGAAYIAPGGNTYSVRNPNASPFYSIRYKAAAGSLNNGKSDIFEYVLPQQSAPDYIHIAGRLADGAYSETHLNTFNCPVQPFTVFRQVVAEQGEAQLRVRPNPSKGQLFVDLSRWQGLPVTIRVLNAQGQSVLDGRYLAVDGGLELNLAESLTDGLYFLSVWTAGGERATTRFVLTR